MESTHGIHLRHPASGDLIGRQLTIAAIGTAFEGSYGWRLVNGSTVYANGFFQAGSMAMLESFVHSTSVSFGHLGPATFQFFGDDPSGGTNPGLDLKEVPVILVPGMVGYKLHTVDRGDTLSELARDYGSTVNAIAVANRLPNPDVINVGQILRIPIT